MKLSKQVCYKNYMSSIQGMSVSTPLPIHRLSRTSPACIKRRPEVHCLRLPSQRYRRRHRRPFRCGKGVIFSSHLKIFYRSTRNNQVGNIVAWYVLYFTLGQSVFGGHVCPHPQRENEARVQNLRGHLHRHDFRPHRPRGLPKRCEFCI